MKLPSIFSNGLLSNPGDKLEARITDTGKQVLKIHKDNGLFKLSQVRYSTGTVVSTIVEKKK